MMTDAAKIECEPAASIVAKLGGETATARIAGCTRQEVHRWQRPRERRGTGGIIPMRRAKAILDWAREHGRDLTEAEFFPR